MKANESIVVIPKGGGYRRDVWVTWKIDYFENHVLRYGVAEKCGLVQEPFAYLCGNPRSTDPVLYIIQVQGWREGDCKRAKTSVKLALIGRTVSYLEELIGL